MATALALPPIAVVDLWLLGLSAVATDECAAGEPCKPAQEIGHTYLFAAIATSVGLALTIATRWPPLRPYRWVFAGLTLLSAAWPALWIITGNPRP